MMIVMRIEDDIDLGLECRGEKIQADVLPFYVQRVDRARMTWVEM
jgi:hypothetical protein